MMKLPIRTLIVCSMVMLSACGQTEPTLDDNIPQNLTRQSIRLQPQAGDAKTLKVQLAQTDFERTKGLMFVTSMPDDEGMLFLFPTAEFRAFWMRNTLIPLDIIYLHDNTVVNVVPWAKPHDESPLQSTEPANMVLEVNGGWAARNSIATGSTLTLIPRQ